MNVVQFLRVISKNLLWLILIPVVIGVLAFFLAGRLPREYQSGTTIYTGLASGNGNSGNENGSSKPDYLSVNNAFDNLLATVSSHQTLEEVSIKLIAQHLLIDSFADPMVISPKSLADFNSQIINEKALLVVPGDFSKTVEKITEYKNATTDNIIVKLLNEYKGHYNLEEISKNLSASRRFNSDFVDINYKSDDPGISYNTLKFITLVFTNKYKTIKGSESVSVLKWFEERLKESADQLSSSEDKLRDFGVKNRIINYYEQAKAVAIENESNESEYYKELMAFEGHKRAVARLEDQLESREILLHNNTELNKLRKDLGVANEEYERAKLYSNAPEKVARLAKNVESIKQEIRLYVLQYYSLNNTIESVPMNVVLERWLNEILGQDASEAKLQVFLERRKDFDRKYSELSPLNGEVNRLEREINVSEKQYLEVLHGFHLAKLRQQNVEMSNNLQVLDIPVFPAKPLSSGRNLLVILSFLISFLFLLVFFTMRELLDNRIKNTARAEELTGISTFSALPDRNKSSNNLLLGKVENTLLDYAVSNLKIELDNNPQTSANYLITVISTREMEGKSYAAQKLAEKLYDLDYSVLYISNDENMEDAETDDRRFRTMRYDITSRLFSAKSEENILPEFSRVNRSSYNFIIVEVPAISINAIPNQLIRNSRLSLLMVDARRSWTDSDNNIMRLYKKAAGDAGKIMLWLNRVAPADLENMVGKMPKVARTQNRAAIAQHQPEPEPEVETA